MGMPIGECRLANVWESSGGKRVGKAKRRFHKRLFGKAEGARGKRQVHAVLGSQTLKFWGNRPMGPWSHVGGKIRNSNIEIRNNVRITDEGKMIKTGAGFERASCPQCFAERCRRAGFGFTPRGGDIRFGLQVGKRMGVNCGLNVSPAPSSNFHGRRFVRNVA